MASSSRSRSKKQKQKQEKQQQKQKTERRRYAKQNENGCWSFLPPQIADKILFLLPLHQALKASAVCKQWRSSLKDRIIFLRSSTSSSKISANLDPIRADELLPILRPASAPSKLFSTFCYHRLLQKWCRFPSLFAFLPPSFTIRAVLASHRGLLLLESSQESRSLLVCNISTQKFALVPSFPFPGDRYLRQPFLDRYLRQQLRDLRHRTCFHLHVYSDGCAYSIFVMPKIWSPTPVLDYRSDRPDWNSPPFACFHSRKGFWEPLPDYDAAQSRHASLSHVAACRILTDVVAFVDDSLFMFMTSSFHSHTTVFRYNIRSSSWSIACELNVGYVKLVAFQQQTVFLIEMDSSEMLFYKLHMPDLQLSEVPETRIEPGFGMSEPDSWYATASRSWPPCIYLGLKETTKGVLEYNVMTKTWTQLLLPRFADEFQELQAEGNTAVWFCAEGYEFGLNTSVLHQGMGKEDETFRQEVA